MFVSTATPTSERRGRQIDTCVLSLWGGVKGQRIGGGSKIVTYVLLSIPGREGWKMQVLLLDAPVLLSLTNLHCLNLQGSAFRYLRPISSPIGGWGLLPHSSARGEGLSSHSFRLMGLCYLPVFFLPFLQPDSCSSYQMWSLGEAGERKEFKHPLQARHPERLAMTPSQGCCAAGGWLFKQSPSVVAIP